MPTPIGEGHRGVRSNTLVCFTGVKKLLVPALVLETGDIDHHNLDLNVLIVMVNVGEANR